MFTVIQSAPFKAWLNDLDDLSARARIEIRIRRAEAGNLGDAKSVGGGIGEMRIDYGPGYRVYFARRGRELLLLLCGGDSERRRRTSGRHSVCSAT